MSFRARPDMYTVAPKVQLADYVDLTMPKRDWSKYDQPSCQRLKSRVRPAQIIDPAFIRRQA